MPDLKQWQDYVSKSKGTAIFVPKELEAEAQAVEKKRKEFNKYLSEVMAKQEIELNIETQNLFFKFRKYLAEKGGQPDIWGKEIGWNTDALKDGILVAHVTDGGK